MPNTFFRFKQFTINQDKTAMKVCTDSCIFGAWVADYYIKNDSIIHVLDIGTGTGLLALMMAQNTNCSNITAIEIDDNAYQQAKENFETSPFASKVIVHHTNFLTWHNTELFDCIICNPPFYENELKSDNSSKNIAMHSSDLLHRQLIAKAINNLQSNGSFWVLLPASYESKFEKMAYDNKLFVQSKLLIRNNTSKAPFRVILQFCKHQTQTILIEDLIIKDQNNNYTNQFIQLLHPYYLYL